MQFKSGLPLPGKPTAKENLVRSSGSQWHNITHPTLTEHKEPENRLQRMVKGLMCKEKPGVEL